MLIQWNCVQVSKKLVQKLLRRLIKRLSKSLVIVRKSPKLPLFQLVMPPSVNWLLVWFLKSVKTAWWLSSQVKVSKWSRKSSKVSAMTRVTALHSSSPMWIVKKRFLISRSSSLLIRKSLLITKFCQFSKKSCNLVAKTLWLLPKKLAGKLSHSSSWINLRASSTLSSWKLLPLVTAVRKS